MLDIGCGIGWSTFEIARHCRNADVLGCELSVRLSRTAHELFREERRVQVRALDFLDADLTPGSFDAAVLLDVYEHFPVDARPAVHARLADLLKPDARIVVTTPSVRHQAYLRAEKPDGLQPVDEDVSDCDLDRLAAELGGRVVSRAHLSIWRPGDYVHTVVERGNPAPPARLSSKLEEPSARAARVQRRLGLRWTANAGFAAARGSVPVCVATWSVSESFIRRHIESLPALVHVLGVEPYRDDSGATVLPEAVARPARAAARLCRRSPARAEDMLLERLSLSQRARLYARHLRRHRIAAVLAEYGPAAVELHQGCRLADVPLVAHFHGYDAFKRDVLERHAHAYRELFREGWPVIAVSDSMRRQLIALGAAPHQVEVVRYGIDLDAFQPGTPTRGLVVTVGRLVEKKAPQLALRAFARAAAVVPDARLVMIGDGPLRPSVEQLVRELDLDGRVTLAGARDHSWVAATLARAAVFMQHSVVAPDGDREGTPLAVLEAAAAAVPVLATRHEGIAEVVASGQTGVLVEEGDVDGMGDALVELLRAPEWARRLGLMGRRWAQDSCSKEQSMGRLWEIIASAAGVSSDSAARPGLHRHAAQHVSQLSR